VKLEGKVARDMLLIGKKYDAKEALKLGIVDGVAEEKEVLTTAINLAKQLAVKGSNKAVYGMLKQQLYASKSLTLPLLVPIPSMCWIVNP